jgi:hypothetical protein
MPNAITRFFRCPLLFARRAATRSYYNNGGILKRWFPLRPERAGLKYFSFSA